MSDDSTKEKILVTAGPLFARAGYQLATLRAICNQADVNIASVHYHFGDKENLYVEAVRRARQDQESKFPFFEASRSLSPEARLRGFIRVLLSRLGIAGPTTWQVQLLVREFMRPGEACRQIVESYFRPYFEQLLTIVDGIAERELASHQRLMIGFSIIGQCLHYRLARPIISMFVNEQDFAKDFNLDALVEHISQFSLNAIRGLGDKAICEPHKPQ